MTSNPSSISNRPNFLGSLWIIIQFELGRIFLSKRGWLYLLTFSLVWYIILASVIVKFSTFIAQNSGWPVPELAIYWKISLYLFPLLCLVTSANQTCTDREKGTLRFLVLRAHRDCIFFGRFIAQMLIQTILVVATVASVLVTAVMRDTSLLMGGLTSTAIIICNLIIVLIPITAMMAVLSASIKTTRQVIVLAILIWLVASAIVKGISHYFPFFGIFESFIPGSQLSSLSDLPNQYTFSLIHIPLLQGIALLVLGWIIMRRTSL